MLDITEINKNTSVIVLENATKEEIKLLRIALAIKSGKSIDVHILDNVNEEKLPIENIKTTKTYTKGQGVKIQLVERPKNTQTKSVNTTNGINVKPPF